MKMFVTVLSTSSTHPPSRRRPCRASPRSPSRSPPPRSRRRARSGSPHDLREDVVALVGRAEPVVPARREARERDDLVRRVLREHRREQRARTIPPKTTMPKHDFGFVRRRRTHSGERSRLRGASGSGNAIGSMATVSSRARAGRGRRRHVHDEVRDEDADGEHEQQRLRQRIVGAERGLLQRQPDARVAEHELDEDEPPTAAPNWAAKPVSGGRIAFRPAYIVITRRSRRPWRGPSRRSPHRPC